jgi:hypothetical protein
MHLMDERCDRTASIGRKFQALVATISSLLVVALFSVSAAAASDSWTVVRLVDLRGERRRRLPWVKLLHRLFETADREPPARQIVAQKSRQ